MFPSLSVEAGMGGREENTSSGETSSGVLVSQVQANEWLSIDAFLRVPYLLHPIFWVGYEA